MNKTWTIIEKIIGVIIGIWGILTLYTVTSTIADMITRGYAAANHLTYFQLFLQNHLNFFLALATLFAGFMLVFNDKKGWLLCIICTALYVFTFFRSSQINSTDTSQPYYAFFKSYSVMALLFLAMLILLIQKPFRKKYSATAKNFLWIAVIIIAAIVDKIIF